MLDREEARRLLPDPRLFLGGERVTSDLRLEVEDPVTGEALLSVHGAGPAEVDAAVTAARAAAPAFAKMDARDRGHLLLRLAHVVKDEADHLAALGCLDVGKPFGEARLGDVAEAIDALTYFGGLADKLEGRTPSVRRSRSTSVTLERIPVGVVGAIIPWNFPLLMAVWKLAPAVAAGCPVILKPAESTPLTALRLADLVHEVGFPKGTVSVLPGIGSIAGRALVEHPGVAKIAFTGSTEVGREILVRGAPSLKRVSLELGGKCAHIVFDDVEDLARVARRVARGFTYNAGQCCTAGTRVLVQRSLHDDFLARLVEATNATRLGDPFHRATEMGPLISAAQLERVMGFVARGKSDGALCIAGGEIASISEFPNGHFVRPTVFTGVDPASPLAREEIFGPVAVVLPFEDEDDAVRLVEDSPYGLAAGIATQDEARARRVARRLEVGTVWINTYNRFDAAVPFGGFKASGFGRENGQSALDLYTEQRAIWLEDRAFGAALP